MEFLIGLFLLILIIVAVFLIVDATQRTANSAKQIARQVTKLRFIMESYYNTPGVKEYLNEFKPYDFEACPYCDGTSESCLRCGGTGRRRVGDCEKAP